MDSYLTHLHQHALEEEEPQLGDGESPAADQEAGEDRGEDVSYGADEDDESSLAQLPPPESTRDVPADSMQNTLPKCYSCHVCGKIYSYLESYRKHLRLHEDPPSTEQDQQQKVSLFSEPLSLRTYECPDCGMSFIRRTRLVSHLRVHRSRNGLQSFLLKCDQCNKCFGNVKLYMAHAELHKQRRFWCLSCARGFLDDVSLDRHLQTHNLKKNTQNTEKESNEPTSQPDPEIKNYQCRYCRKSFQQSRQLNAHKIQHIRRFKGRFTSRKSSAFCVKSQEFNNTEPLTSVKEETKMNENLEELPTSEAAECGDPENSENSEESDCGEPMHRFVLSKPGAETMEPREEQNLKKNEPNEHREHKYWEWECVECDMGFDEMAKLHLHYIKHATGEVPIPQHDPEG